MNTSKLVIFGAVIIAVPVMGVVAVRSGSKQDRIDPKIRAPGYSVGGNISSSEKAGESVTAERAEPPSAGPLVTDGLDESALIAHGRVLAGADPDGAIKWAQAAANERVRYELLAAVGHQIAAKDGEQAVRLAVLFPEGNLRQRYVENVAHAWAARAPQEVASWADGVADKPLQGSIQNAIAIEWAQNDPNAAADYIATQMSDGSAREQAVITVALRWAHLDGPAASAWARSFPAGQLKESVVRAVASVAGR